MFTVLMSVYRKEHPGALSSALESLVNQSQMPEEVVLVQDGPLTDDLHDVIDGYLAKLPMRLVPLSVQVGLPRALNAGLDVARQPWIMRFDTDDFCLPDRVRMQAAMAETGEFDLFGAQIAEFDHDPARARRLRRVPCEHAAIVRYGLRRNPFNHMTVCYRRGLVHALGGYPDILYMQDYALWMRMLSKGVRAANSARVLVHARVGSGLIARRGGLRYAISEARLQRTLVSLGLKNRRTAAIDGFIRSAIFLSPETVREFVYGRFLRSPIDDGFQDEKTTR